MNAQEETQNAQIDLKLKYFTAVDVYYRRLKLFLKLPLNYFQAQIYFPELIFSIVKGIAPRFVIRSALNYFNTAQN